MKEDSIVIIDMNDYKENKNDNEKNIPQKKDNRRYKKFAEWFYYLKKFKEMTNHCDPHRSTALLVTQGGKQEIVKIGVWVGKIRDAYNKLKKTGKTAGKQYIDQQMIDQLQVCIIVVHLSFYCISNLIQFYLSHEENWLCFQD